jgi:hypothetical protein
MTEFERLFGNKGSLSFQTVRERPIVRSLEKFKKTFPEHSVGFIGFFGNIYELTSGVQSLGDLNAFSDTKISQTMKKSWCNSVYQSEVDFVLYETWSMPGESASKTCSNLRFVYTFDENLGVYELIQR